MPLLLRAIEGKATLREAPSDDPALTALSVTGEGMSPVTLFFDRTTGLVAREQYDASGGAGVVQERYFDYRPVDGVQVAFRTVVERPGAPVIERTVREDRLQHSHSRRSLRQAELTFRWLSACG